MEKITITPKGTIIGRAVSLHCFFANFWMRAFVFLFWAASLFSVLAIVRVWGETVMLGGPADSLLPDIEKGRFSNEYLGVAYIIVGLFLAYLSLRSFFNNKLKHPRVASLESAESALERSGGVNCFALFSFELAKSTSALFQPGRQAPARDLALAVVNSSDLTFILTRLGIDGNNLTDALKDFSGSTTSEELIGQALLIAVKEGHHQIEVGDVFVALCQSEPFFKAIIGNLKLEVEDIANIVYWQTSLIRRNLEGKRFLDPKFFRLTGGFGRDWAFGFTPLLNQFGRDITDSVRNRNFSLELIGREKKLKEIEEVLFRQNGGDVILVGDAGIGKKTIIYGLTKRITNGEIDSRLAYKHIIELDIESIIAKGGGDVGNIFARLLDETIRAGNIILFIDNFQNLLSARGEGSVDAADLIAPFLESGSVQLLATCDATSYNSLIRTNATLAAKLTRITIEEPNRAMMIRILEDVVPTVEYQSGSIITYEALKEVAIMADKYIADVPNPEKSIDLLDGAATHAASERGKTLVLPKDIDDYLATKYGVPNKEIAAEEKDKLIKLEEELHGSVIGQHEAIKAIAGALRRARAGVADSKKPIGSFLFLGPTGVGKTETAKALARSYFGGEERMIRLDMSEYQNKEDIYRLIGSNIGGEIIQGMLATAVRENPFSLLLFDEIEKAHSDILDLFLQILDEGYLTDGLGKKAIFSNTIIICTSNAGSNLIRESIRSGVEYDKTKKNLLDYLQQNNTYRPEFLNRFTQIVAFSPLSEEEILEIAKIMIAKLYRDLVKNKGIKVEVMPDALALLAKMGFDPAMGARPMARVIQEKIEDLLAREILTGKLKEGDIKQITVQDLK